MPSHVSHAEEYLFEEFVEESPSESDEIQKELDEKYMTYDDEMEAFDDIQTSVAYGFSEYEDSYSDDECYYTEDD